MPKFQETHRYRTLFLSDLHLGTRGCQAHLILDMLRHVEADTIYLVGDIIDGWRLRSGWYWPQAHNDVVQKLLRKVRRGARMVFVPGNHDEFARQFFGLTFGGIEIKRQAIHIAADGKRYLIIHGDEFDVVVRHSKWLAFFGDWAYDTALFVNTHFNAARRALGLPYWSFSAWAKLKVKNAVNFIGSFEHELAAEARKRGVDGVVCGHIHHPVIRDMEGIIYVNTGDFVESCSLVVEHYDGQMEVLLWKKPLQLAAWADNKPSFEEDATAAGADEAQAGIGLMRILIATDAWRPQVNGVVSTLERMSQAAAEFGASFEFLTSQGMWTAPLPSEPEIRLAFPSWRRIGQRIEETKPDHIHIATEGPIGWLTRHYCLTHKRIFTTSYHTRFAEYMSARIGVPEWLTYSGLRYFHAPSAAVMVPTPTIGADLTRRGFRRVQLWTRGVNHAVYHPRSKRALDLPRPIFLSVGRVAVEKNLDALLGLDLPGSTVIVGDGPVRRQLERRYPHAYFLGSKQGDELADIYASADVFVFPSRTDTFGIVMIEAMASGLPVAAFPVPGPIDVVGDGAGVLDEDLRAACLKALTLSREQAREHSMRFTWKESARQFLENIETSRSDVKLATLSPPKSVSVVRPVKQG